MDGDHAEEISMKRLASCCCGNLRIACAAEPTKVSLCHCLACQKRTGSTYGIAAFFRNEHVSATGRSSVYMRQGESGFSVDLSLLSGLRLDGVLETATRARADRRCRGRLRRSELPEAGERGPSGDAPSVGRRSLGDRGRGPANGQPPDRLSLRAASSSARDNTGNPRRSWRRGHSPARRSDRTSPGSCWPPACPAS